MSHVTIIHPGIDVSNLESEIVAEGKVVMLLIECPHCGPRAQIEFSYGGDATVSRPRDPDAVSAREWLDHVYLRDNPRGPHIEWWHHAAGCRRWFKVRRDTLSHEILTTGAVDSDLEDDS